MTHSDCNEALEAAAAAMFESSPAFSTTSDPKPKRWAWEMIGDGQKEYWRELARVAYRHFANRRPAEPRQEGMVSRAEVLEIIGDPGKAPCGCENCYCGNIDDATREGAWRERKATYDKIYALPAAPNHAGENAKEAK